MKSEIIASGGASMIAGASACDEHPLLPRPLKLLLELRQLSPAALQLHDVRLQNKIWKMLKGVRS